jgi:hypothetical protein
MKSSTSTLFKRSAATALGLLAFSTAAFPECYSEGCAEVFVEELYPEQQGGAWVQTSGNETLANCTVDSNVFLRLHNETGYKEVYATLLTAMITEKKVSIRIVAGSNPCKIAYVRLVRSTW